MVFCYKIITESPRRSISASPTKGSPIGRFSTQNTLSDLIATYDYENDNRRVWDSIPERDWRLLGALARKRDEESERERLAKQFEKLWCREKEEREMVAAETSEQYKRYLHQKRSQERNYNQYKRLLKAAEERAKTGHLVDCIRYKEQRSADLLAWRDDRKVTELIGKAVEEEARAQLAAERRFRRSVADEWQRQTELVHAAKKSEDAKKRRNTMLQNASQRLAINNALSSWETSVVRQEKAALEAVKRASYVARSAVKDERSVRIIRARDVRRLRARKVAAITAQMREAIRTSR